ncbi:MAG: hypothetical protein R3Y47_05045 [Lachnospiraceae bacterium]
MPKITCKHCKKRFDSDLHMLCPKCGTPNYRSSDSYLDAHRSDMKEMVDTHADYVSGTAFEPTDYSKKYHQETSKQKNTNSGRATLSPERDTKPPVNAITKIVIWGLRLFIFIQIISMLSMILMSLYSAFQVMSTPTPEDIPYTEQTAGDTVLVQDSSITVLSCEKLEYAWLDEITPIGYQVVAVAFQSESDGYSYLSDAMVYVGNEDSDSYYETLRTYDIEDALLEVGIDSVSSYSLYSGTYYDYSVTPNILNTKYLIFLVEDSWSSINFYYEEHLTKNDISVLQGVHYVTLPITVYEEEVGA